MKPLPNPSPIARVLCLGVCLAWPLGTLAAQSHPPTLDRQEQAFVAKATADDALQITLAQVALARSQSPGVKTLAQRIINDHQALDRKLTHFSVAKKAQGQAHGTSSSQVTQARLQLAQLQGKALDQAFARKMVEAHKKAIPLYEKAARESADKGLRAIARDGLPLLRQHLQMAQALLSK